MTHQDDEERVANRETVTDLKATVAARRELGPEMEDQLLESFLARIEQRVDQQVAQRPSGSTPVSGHRHSSNINPAAVVAPSLALAIPLIAIAGAAGGAVGVVAVMATVLIINVLFFVTQSSR